MKVKKIQTITHSARMVSQRGETIIEVVIATLVFAVGILGNLGLQSASVQSNKSSLHQTKAILAVNDIAEKIRANRVAALSGVYSNYSSENPPSNPGCTNSPCNSVNIAQYHLFDWSQNFTNVYDDERFIRLLPDGAATINYNGEALEYTINVSWTEQAYEESAAGTQKTDRTRFHRLVLTI
jgi:type IV pilus assembly protein PilV